MNVADGSTIPPHVERDNPPSAPRRDQIASATVDVLKRGGAGKADLLLVDVGRGVVVVKDFHAKPWWGRILGRIQIAREAAAYRWLGRVEGIPVFLGRVDAHALALERVDGEDLIRFSGDPERGGELLRRLGEVLDRIHDAGLVHLDLRSRENVLVRKDGRVVLVDLAGAFWFRPGGLTCRLLFPLLRLADRSAYLKWKARLTPGTLTADEERFLRRFNRWRSLWPFNRKHAAGTRRRR